MFCGRHPLAAKLRRSDIDASTGAVDESARIVGHIRRRWPRLRTLLRTDSGFARETLMACCEQSWLNYVFGLARNPRLTAEIAVEPEAARAEADASGGPARQFRNFTWLTPGEIGGAALYETIYCARGEMENWIKECQLDLFADRTPAATMRANQVRLWLASAAYVLLCALRRLGLAHTQFAEATCGTIRLKLLKIGALVQVSVRRVSITPLACPTQHECALAHAMLRRAAA